VGLLNDDVVLQGPPEPIAAVDVLPERLPEVWSDSTTTGLAISVALSKRAGKPLPWNVVGDALDAAFRMCVLERTMDSAAWPSDAGGAGNIRVRVPKVVPTQGRLPLADIKV